MICSKERIIKEGPMSILIGDKRRIRGRYFLLGSPPKKKKHMIRQSFIKVDRLTNSNAFMLSYIS